MVGLSPLTVKLFQLCCVFENLHKMLVKNFPSWFSWEAWAESHCI